MSEVTLGRLIDGPADRDAIHVAVIPMRAAKSLRPGQRVGIVGDGLAGTSDETVGIVDPFLLCPVPKDSLFWLVLLPNTVTGMRHHWAHPAFDPDGQVAASVAWLRDAAVRLGVEYGDLIGDRSRLVHGEFYMREENVRDWWYRMEAEFWRHREIVTGREVSEGDRGGFDCSC